MLVIILVYDIMRGKEREIEEDNVDVMYCFFIIYCYVDDWWQYSRNVYYISYWFDNRRKGL